MNETDLKYLLDLRQALGTIGTTDTNTIIMGRCLESLEDYIQSIKLRLAEQEKNKEE